MQHCSAPRRQGGICGAVIVASAMAAAAPLPAWAQSGVASAPGGGRDSAIHYGDARPMTLPMSRAAPPSLIDVLLGDRAAAAEEGPPSVWPGAVGNGVMAPVRLAPAKPLQSTDAVTPQEFCAVTAATTGHRCTPMALAALLSAVRPAPPPGSSPASS